MQLRLTEETIFRAFAKRNGFIEVGLVEGSDLKILRFYAVLDGVAFDRANDFMSRGELQSSSKVWT